MEHQPTPCPDCGYDLQGQEVPRCPECGSQFSSMPEMVEASQHAARVFVRVLRWRVKLAYILGAGTLVLSCLVGLVFLSEYFDTNSSFNPTNPSIPIIVIVMLLVSFSTFILGGILSLILLLQVVRYYFDRRIPADRRRELIGTIPLLLFYLIPASLALFVITAIWRSW